MTDSESHIRAMSRDLESEVTDYLGAVAKWNDAARRFNAAYQQMTWPEKMLARWVILPLITRRHNRRHRRDS